MVCVVAAKKAKDFKGTMKKLFNYIKPFKFTFLIGILCAVVSVCIMVIGPKIQGNIITEIAEGFMNKYKARVALILMRSKRRVPYY